MSTVSIIIPAFNSAQYLSDTIQSCLVQTYKDIETIVVDDGSTDNTREVAQRFPITYIYQANKGPAAARNNGWDAANGDYLQFLDADDILLPTKIERCIQAFAPDIDVVYTNYERRSPDLGESWPMSHGPTVEGNILDTLLVTTQALCPVHAPLIRRSTAERTRKFNEQIKIAEDWYFWIELAVYGATFRYVDEPLVWYRATPGSISDNALKLAQGRLVAAEALSQLPLPESFDLNLLLAERHHILAIRHWAVGNTVEARQHFRQAVTLSPKASGRQLIRYYLMLMTYVSRLQTAELSLKHVLRAFNKT